MSIGVAIKYAVVGYIDCSTAKVGCRRVYILCFGGWNVKIYGSEPVQSVRGGGRIEVQNGLVIHETQRVAMNNACWLRKSLHPQYCPQIDLRAWLLAI